MKKFNIDINITFGKLIGFLAFLCSEFIIIGTFFAGIYKNIDISFTQLVIQQVIVLGVCWTTKASVEVAKKLKNNIKAADDI